MSHQVNPFIALSTGGRFYPLGPDPERVDIRDIAHSLSNQCRYAGHTSSFWSVAAHSLEVSRRVERILFTHFHLPPLNAPDGEGAAGDDNRRRTIALTGLLHDASETYLQDIVRPI